MDYPKLYGEQIQRTGCGRTACESDALVFWQSRMTVHGRRAELIRLVDLDRLARDLRRYRPNR